MPQIRTYFSQKDNLQSILLKHLDKAQVKVCVAVAWFTDGVLFQKLLHLQKRNIQVELIITKHQFNDESQNNYEDINMNGGVFLEVGGDASTMHHKFCLIDGKTVLNGSFNWTRRANQSNNETLMLIEDDVQSAFDFANEFDRLKRLAGLEQEVHDLQIAKAMQYFKLIRAFIEMNRPNDMLPYLQEIKDIEELRPITSLLIDGKYEEALRKMSSFEKSYTSLTNSSFYEKEELAFRIRLLSDQLRQLEVEQAELDEIISTFNRRFILELNPLISRILELKKKLAKKFGISDEEFEELSQQYEKTGREYQAEKSRDIPVLTEEEAIDIRKIYYEASKLCHPDSPTCVISDKKKAEDIFHLLTLAYKNHNSTEVKRIFDELKRGDFNPENLMASELEQLRRRLAALKKKCEQVIGLIRKVKLTEPFLTINKIQDWDEFFSTQKLKLEAEEVELKIKYFKA